MLIHSGPPYESKRASRDSAAKKQTSRQGCRAVSVCLSARWLRQWQKFDRHEQMLGRVGGRTPLASAAVWGKKFLANEEESERGPREKELRKQGKISSFVSRLRLCRGQCESGAFVS